jgi:hypothetical protein
VKEMNDATNRKKWHGSSGEDDVTILRQILSDRSLKAIDKASKETSKTSKEVDKVFKKRQKALNVRWGGGGEGTSHDSGVFV